MYENKSSIYHKTFRLCSCEETHAQTKEGRLYLMENTEKITIILKRATFISQIIGLKVNFSLSSEWKIEKYSNMFIKKVNALLSTISTE